MAITERHQYSIGVNTHVTVDRRVAIVRAFELDVTQPRRIRVRFLDNLTPRDRWCAPREVQVVITPCDICNDATMTVMGFRCERCGEVKDRDVH